ncbi:Cytosolic Fe-S cluster assembly factor NARFL [Blattamonas nauphoetae]|uniref:Cytosolic Fe-S cluster assembly factor NARFL n=1 Tax=Blattamonas nauphoetae TaxID=2049346 RepID=A0ABQ9YL46_9EUKA|nr:Cytosolic Fe-S cluster assembly factor NARFL [Blattamonas nauphoetae]
MISLSSLSVSDYIAPSQNCVIPVQKEEVVKVSLNDCLACSGCVTSAESVLISEQGIDELDALLKENFSKSLETKQIFVASIEPQVATSFAALYNLPLTQAYFFISGFLHKTLGFDYVLDSAVAQCLSVQALISEVESRLDPILSSPNPPDQTSLSKLPLLSGTCPGFVCYLEKVHPTLIPHLLHAPSVQHMQGVLVKYFFAPILSTVQNIPPTIPLQKRIYHVAFSPCYDRKIESLRWAKTAPIIGTEFPVVDSVLTLKELLTLFERHHIVLSDPQTFQNPPFPLSPCDHAFGLSCILTPESVFPSYPAPSGGYAESVERHLVERVTAGTVNAMNQGQFEQSIQKRWASKVTKSQTNNALEFSYENPSLPMPVTTAAVFGFRHLQTMIQKLKAAQRQSSSALQSYMFVDLEACPSACLGGGGLPSAVVNEKAVVENLQSVQQSYSPIFADKQTPLVSIPTDIAASLPFGEETSVLDALQHVCFFFFVSNWMSTVSSSVPSCLFVISS